MFFLLHQEEDQSEKFRTVYLFENGKPDTKPVSFKIVKKKTTFRHIAKLYQCSNLRIFNAEGSECFEEDLDFIKNDSVLYISRGEEFDPLSCFAEYELLKLLGEGGYGKVYLAEHKQTKKKCAIKVIKTEKIESASDIDAIFIEAEILKSLKHQNIVQVYQCLTMKNMEVVIIMEYLEGGDLLKYVSNLKCLGQADAMILIKQVVKGIFYCHQNNLTHRDLKLENLLLVNSEDKKIKIIDFGIAGVISSTKWEQVDTGSLSYMAPQCFMAQKNFRFDGKIDVWAIGVTLYAMLCGDLPFKGSSVQDTIECIKEGKYRIPPSIEKTLSTQCINFLESCLDPSPKTRISIEDLINHLWLEEGIFISEQRPKVTSQISLKIQPKEAIKSALNDIGNRKHKRQSSLSRIKDEINPRSLSKNTSTPLLPGRRGCPVRTQYPKSKFR